MTLGVFNRNDVQQNSQTVSENRPVPVPQNHIGNWLGSGPYFLNGGSDPVPERRVQGGIASGMEEKPGKMT